MKTLSSILQQTSFELTQGDLAMEISSLTFDSRKAEKGSVFIAIVGTVSNGHDFVQAAYELGCRAFVVEKNVGLPSDATIIHVSKTDCALAELACAFYDQPSKELKLVGITGTNGKTTTTTLLHDLFTSLGYSCGLISTVVNKIGTVTSPSTHTTPDPIRLNALLRSMVEQGCSHCFMEVSSHGIHQKRTAGLKFVGGIFTNLTHDHLDYHKTFQEYRDVKKIFFDELPKTAFALVNADDKNGLVMLQNSKAKKYTYALKTMADFKAKIIENQFSGLLLNINGNEVWAKLIGSFNAYNLLAVYGTANLLGLETNETLTLLSELESVNGRFQHFISKEGITAVVDYAHTPDALKNVLETINDIKTGNEQIITVVGCGGNRDKAKRPIMGRIASQLSAQVIFTSDNPRDEDPQTILNEIESGVAPQNFKKTISILDREQAIKTATKLAKVGDIILIAGKGHETYQEVKGVRSHFDDYEKIMKLL